jgi:ribosomal protein S14
MFLKHLDKDKIRRIMSYTFEIKLLAVKQLTRQQKNNIITRSIVQKTLQILYKLNNNCFFIRVNNICILSGRQSGVYKILKISRIEIRDSKHDTYGLRKSS